MPLRRSGTRYERVREILDAAAGDSPADYGGAGAFWRLDLGQFKETAVHGIAMIAPEPAPEPAAGACGCAATPAPAARSTRSAASGLIQGLSGEAPFDGSRFPPLPWGGQRVPEADIRFIAEWIDDGCPEADHLLSHELETLDAEGGAVVRADLGEVAEFEVFEGGVNAFAFRQDEVRQRANIDCMPEAQLDELRAAFRSAYALCDWANDRRSFNNQALIHQNHCQHGWERFLPWHRAYCYEFEQNLRDLRPGVMLPYWDWTMAQYRPEEPEKGDIIPRALKAYLTEAAADELIHALDPPPTPDQKAAIKALAENRRYFVSQHAVFSHLVNDIGYRDITPKVEDANRRRVIDALLDSNALWYPLRYPASYQRDGKPGTINEIIHYHYPSRPDMQQILGLNNFRDFGGGSMYNDSFGFLDQNPHNTMHIWTGGQNPDAARSSYADDTPAATGNAPPEDRNRGVQVSGRSFHKKPDLYTQPANGDMFSNLTASYDPVFWPIHINVDRTWWQWQLMNPHANPLDLDATLTPWPYTIRDTLSIEPFGYEYVRGAYLMPVGLEAPIGRFVSRPIPVPKALHSFRKAEIRLHRVPQLMRSCFVRAFLNAPGADASTPVRDNPHFAGYLSIFGHGACYGGPGHCDLPPPRARADDRRERSHNTPRNHRIDVTACARHVLANADSLQITLVVIGADYQEDVDLLKLEGVALTILD